MKSPFRLSKSKVLLYKHCPRKYKFIIVDGRVEDPSPAMEKGKELHEIFEEFYNDFNGSKTIPSREELLQKAEKFSKGKYPEEIDNFVDFNENRIRKRQKEWLPIAVEKKYYDKEYDFSGIIDVVYQSGEKVLVLDYKTGRRVSQKINEYRFELAGYTHLWDKFNPTRKTTHWGIFFASQEISEKNPWIEPVIQQSSRILQIKLSKMKTNLKEDNFPQNFGDHCRRCAFYFDCHNNKGERNWTE